MTGWRRPIRVASSRSATKSSSTCPASGLTTSAAGPPPPPPTPPPHPHTPPPPSCRLPLPDGRRSSLVPFIWDAEPLPDVCPTGPSRVHHADSGATFTVPCAPRPAPHAPCNVARSAFPITGNVSDHQTRRAPLVIDGLSLALCTQGRHPAVGFRLDEGTNPGTRRHCKSAEPPVMFKKLSEGAGGAADDTVSAMAR